MKIKNIILVITIILIVGSIYYLESLKASPGLASESSELENLEVIPDTEDINISEPTEETKEIIDSEPLPPQPAFKDDKYPLTPELTGIVGYLNSEEGIKISDFRGKVVLIDFWTYSCINCIRTLPHLTAWDTKYKDAGLVIIGVHTPEFGFEKKAENVFAAMEKYNVEYRVVQDNNYATWQAFKNRFWPHKFLIDSEGYVRYDHIGEGAYDETEMKVQELLAEIGMETAPLELSDMPDTTPKLPTTPELYAGYVFAIPRGQNLGNADGFQREEIANYDISSELESHLIYLEGIWQSNSDNLEAKDSASIILDFLAHSVNIVADSINDPIEVDIFINDKYIPKEQAGSDVQFSGERAFIVVDEPRLYNVVNGGYGMYTLKLAVPGEFIFNAFTFG
tara:strand:+ start:308 stop:1492 length:1185 start_codon:yes stop_codon:yes gene_type:complete